MNLTAGQHIKCIFRNGTIVEGIVKEWSSNYYLQSLTDDSLLVILDPRQDLMMIKIMPTQDRVQVEEPDAGEPDPPKSYRRQIRRKLQELGQIDNPDLKRMSVVELRELAHQLERQELKDKIKEHFPTSSPRNNYSEQSTLLSNNPISEKPRGE